MWRIAALIALVSLAACLPGETREVLRLSGSAMGTQYNIVAIGDDLDASALRAGVDDVLEAMNVRLSNWTPTSEVSRFSASRQTGAQAISRDFAKVMEAAERVHTQSGGMFDVTLGPLIDLWGFGARGPDTPRPGDELPGDTEIREALAHVGQARLLTLDPATPSLEKTIPEVEVNVAAIAKGYGIDALAQMLVEQGIEDFLVEIGGDLMARGTNDAGEPWRIGIETPHTGAHGSLQRVIPLSGMGMATSGDYRNFFERDGRRYSHLLDPTTGRPVTHSTTSATVLAQNAMLADAWATAMLVLGAERGLAVAERHGVAVFFISRDRQTASPTYIQHESSAFSALFTSD